MGTEIERKFLVDVDKLSHLKPDQRLEIKQSFIVKQPGCSVRVRIYWDPDEDRFYQIPVFPELCVKIGSGPIRLEYEQQIPLKEAEALLTEYPTIHKMRSIYHIENSDRYWEVDQFFGANEGVWLAEIELDSLDEEIELPDWIREEVTWNADYYNCNLAK